MSKRPTHCTYCGNELDHEERRWPCRDEAKAVMCDRCYQEHYQGECSRCGDLFEKTELSPKPGRLIGIWRDAPACGQDDLPAGYYRVLSWPMYADGMIEGYFFGRALSRIGPLDALGQIRAEEESYISGPLCHRCQWEARRNSTLALCLIGDNAPASTRNAVTKEEKP